MSLLLVEEDEMLAEPMLAALRRDGHCVDWANDQCAAKSLCQGRYDLLILDMNRAWRSLLDVLTIFRQCNDGSPVTRTVS